MLALTSLVCIAWKFWLEWNARNGTGFSCLTFHWHMHRCFSRAKLTNEHDLKFFVIFCCRFAKILLVFGHFFFLFVNLSRIFHSFRTRQLAHLCRERGNPGKKKYGGIRARVFIYLGNFPMDWAVPSGFLTGIFGFRWHMANAAGLNYFLRMIDLKYFCEIDFRSRPCRGRSAIRGRIAIASLVQLKASWNHTLSYKKPWNAYKPTWDRKKASWIFWGRISEFIYCS